MKIKIYNKKYTESNHISKEPLALLKNLKEIFNESYFTNNVISFKIKNKGYTNNLIIIIIYEHREYWLKYSEYNLLIDYVNNNKVDLNVVNDFQITYLGGLIRLENGKERDYYTTYYKLQKEPELFKVCEADILDYTKNKIKAIPNNECN